MKSDEKLPRELVWDGTHVTELALSAIADGETALVEDGAVEHVDACEWCAGRLGRLALLTEAVGHAVTQVRPASVSSRPPARVMPKPWRALGAGTAVAVLAGLPALAHLGSFVDAVSAFFAHGVPVLARGGFALALAGAERVEGDVAGDAGQPRAHRLVVAEASASLERAAEGLVAAVVDVGVVAAEAEHGGADGADVGAELRRLRGKGALVEPRGELRGGGHQQGEHSRGRLFVRTHGQISGVGPDHPTATRRPGASHEAGPVGGRPVG